MELPSAIVSLGTIRLEDSRAAFELKKLVSGRLGIHVSIFPRHAQSPCE